MIPFQQNNYFQGTQQFHLYFDGTLSSLTVLWLPNIPMQGKLLPVSSLRLALPPALGHFSLQCASVSLTDMSLWRIPPLKAAMPHRPALHLWDKKPQPCFLGDVHLIWERRATLRDAFSFLLLWPTQEIMWLLTERHEAPGRPLGMPTAHFLKVSIQSPCIPDRWAEIILPHR